jgi:hypothetical protein
MTGATDKRLEYLRGLVRVLPDDPGVYQFFDETGKIIYVGKAKNLKKRVSTLKKSGISAILWSTRKRMPCCSRTI